MTTRARAPATGGTQEAGGARTDHRLMARLVLASFIVIDAADFPYRILLGDGPQDPWAPGLHRLAGLVACLSLLWGWRRTLLVSALVTAGFVLARDEITGFELWWLPIAMALAVASRSWTRVGLVVTVWAALSWWTHEAHGGASAIGVTVMCLLGAAAGVVLGFVTAQRADAEARLKAVREENARLRHEERRLLAGDLREATEGLFTHARRASARSLTSDDPADLRRALRVVRDDARAALVSLRQLLEVLRTTGAEPDAELDTREQRAFARIRSVRLAAAITLGGLAIAGALGATGLAPHGWLPVAALAAASVTCLRPGWGVPVCLLVLGTTLLVDTTAWVHTVSVAATVAAASLAGWRTSWRLAALAPVVAYGVARVALGGADTLHDMAGVAGGVLGATLVALALQDYLYVLRRSTSDQRRLASERVEIGPGERAALARELHDQLGHQLSLVALQVNAVDHVRDPAQLREALGRIDTILATAAGELTVQLSVMDAAPASPAASGPMVTPSVVARLMTERLVEHDHETSLVVDPAADELDPTTRLTVVRVLQEATTNVLRHGDPGVPVHGGVSLTDAEVSVTVSNPVPTGAGRLSVLSSGYGLRGIRERADASGGTFSAGVVGPDWRVSVALPIDAEQVSLSASRDRV